MSHDRQPTGEAGLSLVELMVALAIGLLISVAAIRVFMGALESSRFQMAQARTQEIGRFTLHSIAPELRSIDYRGCTESSVPARNTQNLLADTDTSDDLLEDPIRGYTWLDDTNTGSGEGRWDTELPAALTDVTPAPHSNGDVIVVQSVANSPTEVSSHETGKSGKTFFVFDGNGIRKGDVVIATDCNDATIFQVTNKKVSNNDNSGAKGSPLGYNPGGSVSPGNVNESMDAELDDGTVFKISKTAYFLGSVSMAKIFNPPVAIRIDPGAGAQPAVFSLSR